MPTKQQQRLRTVFVDTKEARNHDMWFDDSEVARNIPGTFIAEGMQTKTRVQEFGDLWIELRDFNWLVVEMKTWEDFHTTIRDTGAGRADSRIRHQVQGLLNLQAKGFAVMFCFVGIVTKAGGKAKAGRRPTGVYVENKGRRVLKPGWSYHELESARLRLQQLGIPTVQAPSEAEVPHTLRLAAEAFEELTAFPQPGLARIASLGPRHSFLTTLMTAVADIGPSTASDVASAFHSFPEFYSRADVKLLQEIPGIGKLTAQKIYDAFHGTEPDPEPKAIEEVSWP